MNIKCDIVKDIVPKMKSMVADTIKAVSRKVDPNRLNNTFEIFGYDFMIDEDFNPWMIEVNTNQNFQTKRNSNVQSVMIVCHPSCTCRKNHI